MSLARGSAAVREAEPGRKGLWLGILAFRWAAYVWMTALAILSRDDFRLPWLAWAAIVMTGVWTAWLTATRGWERAPVRWVDLGLAVGLILVSSFVMQPGAAGRDVPFFATSYPASVAMTIGAASGVAAGLWSGLALSVALAIGRPLNGVPFDELTPGQWAAIGNGAAYYLSAGGAVGLVQRVLTRSGAERRSAVEEAARERERAARLAERESLGRQIHDSVLQVLAMITKRGAELSAQPVVPAEEVQSLVDLARLQERALRALIQSAPEEPPGGTVSLRTVLEAAAFGVQSIPVSITTVEPIWLHAKAVDEVSAAIHQALENVADHAQASRASLFAEVDDSEIVISVRDDGVGFVYDEERLRREGKLGVLKSMKGRIEDLGGSMRVNTAPGRGTEVEFRLPVREEAS